VAGKRRTGVPIEFARMPMRTLRPMDAEATYPHPRTQLARLEQNGLLHKVAVGYYVVVPQDQVGQLWKPTIEAVAGGIAAAAVGIDHAVLMGVTAARLHNAIPRALAIGIVAAPKRRHDIELCDRVGRIHFVGRPTATLDAELMQTELGACLVTTPEQTVLDLAHRPDLGHAAGEARAAIKTLLRRCDPARLDEIAGQQRLRAALARARTAGQVTGE
jgi:predicted transcriptional regulator of viral defense system